MIGAWDADEIYVAWCIALAFLCFAVCLAFLVTPILIAVFDGLDCTDDEIDVEEDDVEKEHMFN